MNLCTLGYEGLDIARFVARLREAGVCRVADVRENPFSRKPGFSRRALAEALAAAGIAYVHLPLLGCPRPIRERHRQDGDWRAYTDAFCAYLETKQEAVADLARMARAETTCLVCYEADFNACHRSFVARAAARCEGLEVVHLAAAGETPDGSTAVGASSKI